MKTMAIVAGLALGGCASLLSDSTKTIRVTARPGAPVLVDGVPAGYAPINVVVNCHRDHVIVVEDQSCRLTAGVGGGWLFLDVVIAGGWVIDAITGEWKDLDAAACVFDYVAPHKPRQRQRPKPEPYESSGDALAPPSDETPIDAGTDR